MAESSETPCPHPTFTSEVVVTSVTPTSGTTPYMQAQLQVQCATCAGQLVFAGLPVHDPTLYRTVAILPGGVGVVLAGQMAAPAES